MDANQQQSFIPKQPPQPTPIKGPTTRRARRTVSALSVLAAIALFVALISSGGIFFFKQTVLASIEQKNASLEAAEKQFEPRLIEDLRELDTRMEVADDLLRQHRSTAPFFNILSDLVLKSVQFDDFEFSYEEGVALVYMRGKATDFNAIARQSEEFKTTRYIDEFLFSNFALEDNARVSFELLLRLSDEVIVYEKSIENFPEITL